MGAMGDGGGWVGGGWGAAEKVYQGAGPPGEPGRALGVQALSSDERLMLSAF